MEILLAVAIAALLGLTASIVWTGRAFLLRIDSKKPDAEPVGPRVAILELAAEVDKNRDLIEGLTLAVSEGIAGYKRHETRVQKTIASARRLVAANGLEHAALDAEADEIRNRDEKPSEDEQLQLMPAPVDDRRTGIPGVSAADLDRIREG